ncbi:MAG: hypothetical protein MCSN_2170 [Candidatus Microsyncoccus archaeolyticus]|nr:MAG: hypothetical protein MCSN_2170 [Candidatus Parcubacteria bacterium]
MMNFNELSKYVFLGFGFLFPFCFLTTNLLIAKTCLAIFVLLIFTLQLVESYKTKEYSIPKNILIVFLFVLFLSSLFSKNLLISLFEGVDSFFFLFSIFLAFVFSRNILKKKEDILLFIGLLCFSLVIISVIIVSGAVAQKFYGMIEPLSLLIGVTLGISLYCIFSRQRKFEIIIYSIFSFTYFCALLVIGYKIAWFVVSLFAFFIFWKKTKENDFSFAKRKVLFSLICFLIFFILFLTPKFINNSIIFNPSISMGESSLIAFNSIFQDVKSFVLGSGPGTFNYEYARLFIPINVDQGASGLLTILSDIGFLGLVIFVSVFVAFIFNGIKSFLEKNSETEDIVFITTFVLFSILIVFRIEIILMFLLFVFLGIYEAFNKKEKIISFKSLLVAFIVFFIMSSIYFSFLWSEKLFKEASLDDLDKAINKTESASRCFQSTDYYIGLSQLYLIKSADIFDNNWDLSEDVKEQKEENEKNMKAFASQAEATAERATVIDKYNYLAWQNLGLIYENTSYLVNDNTDKAIEAFNKALELSPKNYLVYIAKGRIYEENKKIDEAKEEYIKALEIYPNYQGLKEKIDSLD